MKRLLACAASVCIGLMLSGCDGERDASATEAEQLFSIPRPDLTGAEPEVIRAVERDVAAIAREPGSAGAWGTLGARYRAGNWLAEAGECYAQAERLEPNEFAWPYRRGLALRFSDLETAVAALARALEIDPFYLPAIVHHAQRLVRLGREDEARSGFERALELEPGNAHALVALGQLALAAGEFVEARSYLELARKNDPELGAAHRALAQVYLELGDDASSAESSAAAENLPYLSAIEDPRALDSSVAPVGSVARVDAGKALLERGFPDKAIDQLEIAIEADPENVLAHYTMALALIQLDRYEGATAHLEQVRRLRPASPNYFNATAQMLFRQGEHARAAQLWRESVHRDPDDPEVHYALADVLIRTGERTEAERHLRQSLALDPGNADVHFALGALLNDRRSYDEAAIQLNEAARLDPQDDALRFYLGTFLAQRGRMAEAVPHLQAAARALPDDPAIRVNLGVALARQGETQPAIDELRRALQLAPDWSRPAYRLAWIYATHPDAGVRNASEAVRLAERAAQASRGPDAAALDTLAAAYAEAGRFDEAIEVAVRAEKTATESNRQGLAQAISRRLELYRTRRPYRDP